MLFANLQSGLDKVLAQTYQWIQRPGEINGFATGIPALDQMVMGIDNDHLVIVAGRPSMGKTAFMQCIALNHVINSFEESAVLFVSTEAGMSEFSLRLAQIKSGVSSMKMKQGLTNDEENILFCKALEEIAEYPIAVCELPAPVIESRDKYDKNTVAGNLRQALTKHPIACLMVDYLERCSDGQGQQENYRLAKIVNDLKALAMETKVPVILASQLNRNVEDRDDKKPCMSDLKGTGTAEQTANTILLLYRQDRYFKEGHARYNPQHAGKAEIIVDKNRNGPTGSVFVNFDANTTKFY